jgi:hypothetical protein
MQFLTSLGQNLTINLDGQTGTQFPYSIPARSSRKFRTAGTASTTATGSIEIVPSGNTRTPSVAGVLIRRVNNITVTETAVIAAPPGNGFRIPAEVSGNFGAREALSTQTGVAISNPAATPVVVTIEATNPDGTVAGTTQITIAGRGQTGPLLGDIPGLQLPNPFSGLLWVSAPRGSSISVSGLRARYNERQTPDLLVTAFPAADEAAPAQTEMLFPQVVDSGGYTTQFVLMGVRGGSSAGALRFVSQSGQPLPLPVR